MKIIQTLRALAGVALCGLGLWLALTAPSHPRTFRIDAGGCRLVTDIFEPAGGAPQGYVVLLHGISVNKRVMSYLAQGFTEQGLRVFAPDLPGHGRTGGPFSYAHSDQCSEKLVRELIARGLLDPERTILAGHSLGGAIALRVASRVPVAGVIAISPAPMRPVPGVSAEMMPFPNFGNAPTHSLLLAGGWESEKFNMASKELVPAAGDATSQFVVIPHATHASILFDARTMSTTENWAAQVLHLAPHPVFPSRRNILGLFDGFIGILLLAGPFLREILQNKKRVAPLTDQAPPVRTGRAFLEQAIVALGVVVLLSLWNPLRLLHLFEGDYFAGFLLLLGIVLVALHWNSLRGLLGKRATDAPPAKPFYATLFLAAIAAFILYFLFTGWVDLTFSESWLTAARWARFAPFLVVVLPYHIAEELLLGPPFPGRSLRRLLTALLLRLTAWITLVVAIFFLHSGEILLVLLAPYFGLFCVLQRSGMNVVREVTASPAATALFGAILLAGFCLVVFPTT